MELRTRADESSDLDGLIEALEAGPDLPRLLALVAESSRRHVGAASLSISLWEREERQLRAIVNVGRLGPDEVRWPVGEVYALDDYPAAAQLLESGRSYAFVEGDPCDPESEEMFDRLDKGTQIGVPIMVDGEIWGELYATAERGSDRPLAPIVRELEGIAVKVGLAISQSQRLAGALRDATVDPLTGVGNRRALTDRLGECLDSATGAGAFLLVDLDDLKGRNDAFGHGAGDAMLLEVALSLRARAAAVPGAFVGRLGGDEFALVLPATSVEEAESLARHSCDEVRERSGGSFTWGAAPIAGTSVASIIAAADRQLYARKLERPAPAAPPRRRHFRDRLTATDEAVLESVERLAGMLGAPSAMPDQGLQRSVLRELERIRAAIEDARLRGR